MSRVGWSNECIAKGLSIPSINTRLRENPFKMDSPEFVKTKSFQSANLKMQDKRDRNYLNTDLSNPDLSSGSSALNKIDESPETPKLNVDSRERRKSFKPIINLKKTGTLSTKNVISSIYFRSSEKWNQWNSNNTSNSSLNNTYSTSNPSLSKVN